MNKEHKKIHYVNYCHVLNPGIAFVMFPSLYLAINTYLVPKLFRKVQCGTRTLGIFNLIPQFSKEVQFGSLR